MSFLVTLLMFVFMFSLVGVSGSYAKGLSDCADIKDNIKESQNTNEQPKTDEPTETEMSDVVGEPATKEVGEQATKDVGEQVGKDVGEQVGKTIGTEAAEEGTTIGLAQFIPGADVVVDIAAIGGLIYTAVHGARKAKEEHAKQVSYDNELKKENDIDNMTFDLTSVAAPTRSRQQELQGGITTSD